MPWDAAAVRDGLDRFAAQVCEALGEQLVSIVLYGGLAKNEYNSATSDVNLMLVLRQVSLETLDKIAPAVRQGVRDFRLSVMVLSEQDLRQSTDAFPVKFLDMQRHHRVLWGSDVLEGLTIAQDHLRLRCEQEIRNLLLRLRQFYLHRADRPELIESTLTNAISSFLTSLAVAVMLKTGRAPDGKADTADAAAREWGLDRKVLQELLALKSRTYKPDTEQLRRLYNDFMLAVQRAAEIVDQL